VIELWAEYLHHDRRTDPVKHVEITESRQNFLPTVGLLIYVDSSLVFNRIAFLVFLEFLRVEQFEVLEENAMHLFSGELAMAHVDSLSHVLGRTDLPTT
jgi:hypothetical protein